MNKKICTESVYDCGGCNKQILICNLDIIGFRIFYTLPTTTYSKRKLESEIYYILMRRVE